MLTDALAQFLEHLALSRQMSPHTVSNYRRDFDAFIAFLEHRGQTPAALDPVSIDELTIRQFVARQHAKGLAPKSLARQLSALRSFFSHRMKHFGQRHNPAKTVRPPKAPRKLPHTLDADQMGHMLDTTPDNELEMRDRALFELIYSSGLRLSETIGLDLTDIDRNDATVRVMGKGRKVRIVPVGRKALEAIEEWLPLRASLVTPGHPTMALFVTRDGHRISARNVQARLKQWGLKAGTDRRVHPHLLRHSFASHMLESSGDLRAVQELLGHADISTTQIYTHLDFQHLATTYDKAHPRARRKETVIKHHDED